MSADIYSSLVKALTVRVTAAAAISQLVQNDYMPPEWLPLLQVVCRRLSDEEEDSSIYFQLLSTLVETGNEKIAPHSPDIVCSLVCEIQKNLPLELEPWPQMYRTVKTTDRAAVPASSGQSEVFDNGSSGDNTSEELIPDIENSRKTELSVQQDRQILHVQGKDYNGLEQLLKVKY